MGSITPRRWWLNGGSLRFLSISSSSVHQHTKSPFITTTQTQANNNHNDMLCCITQHLQPSINNHCQQLSSFSTKVRRRRRDGGGVSIPIDIEENNNDDAPSPTTTADFSAALSSQQFHIEANLLLDKVESAMIKLLDCNNGLEIERHPPTSFISTDSASNDDDDDDDDDENNNQQPQEHSGQLSIQVESSGDLFWGGGTYWLTIQSEGQFVTLQSLSGSYTYVYNTSTNEWVGDEDGHSLLGMLTRDWIRQAKGVPDF